MASYLSVLLVMGVIAAAGTTQLPRYEHKTQSPPTYWKYCSTDRCRVPHWYKSSLPN